MHKNDQLISSYRASAQEPFDANRKAISSAQLFDLASRVVVDAESKKLLIGTAESCTAGLISARIADIPGASNVLAGGIVSYSNEIKKDILGVSSATLSNHGAVSEETALQMAQGAKTMLKCDIAVSATGIAGPGGAVPGKPVGTVWIGIASKNTAYARLFNFDGDREQVRMKTVYEALSMLIDMTKQHKEAIASS